MEICNTNRLIKSLKIPPLFQLEIFGGIKKTTQRKLKMARITKDWIMTIINHHQKLIEEKEEKGIDDKEHKKIVDYFKKELTKIK
tara:strand:+ start:624 stop:878 length:255 start_codon:yes stop_codon:yes gene_type:complete